jgi:serine/threonine protein kinase
MIGRRIGSFEITARLGSGAMGDVYRARDTRLGREVAIKLLAGSFAADPDRVARFDREARLLAALNHPHIASIYSVENRPDDATPGGRALVLELVEGETLAERLDAAAHMAGSPAGLAYDDAIAIARQIADALDAAHEKGVVHRDLKPANIKITPGGVVKVLDFGLATTAQSLTGSGWEAPSTLTREGTFLGTPAYMSPEQARGQAVDKRADIWAFGAILFELLTGRQAFEGQSISDTIAAIIDREPDWSCLPAATAPPIRRLLQRCLTKDVKARLRDIGDAQFEEPIETSRSAFRTARGPGQFQRLTDAPGLNGSPALSPDGKMVAFVTPIDGRRQICVLLLAGGAPLQITRDDLDHAHPRWTPDSSAILYYTPPPVSDEAGTIWEVAALGGQPRPIVSAVGGADVSHDGRRLAFFRVRGSQQLVTTARDGSDERVICEAPTPEVCGLVRWSPDDQSLLFHARIIHLFNEQLFIVNSAGGHPHPVVRGLSISGVSWLPDGSGFVYSSSAASSVPYPAPCNLRIARRDGSDDRAVTFGDVGHVEPDLHPSGKLVACRVRSDSDIWRIPVHGAPADNTRAAIRITRQTGQVQTPCVSPDGRSIVYLSDHGGHGNLWISAADGTRSRQLTFERDPAVTVGAPIWSPSGRQIIYVSSPGTTDLWLIAPDGRGARRLVAGGFAACWSPDSRWIYYVPVRPGGELSIERVSVDGGPPQPIRPGPQDNSIAATDTDLFWAVRVTVENTPHWEIRRGPIEGGSHQVLGRLAPERLPGSPAFIAGALSPDGRFVAMPLMDGETANVWLMPTDGGEMRPVTDFGDECTLIVRRVSWMPDSGSVVAAVARVNSDVILLDGLI